MKSPAARTLFRLTRQFLILTLILADASFTMAQSTGQQGLTNDDVLKMVSAHMDESKIVWMIQNSTRSLLPDHERHGHS